MGGAIIRGMIAGGQVEPHQITAVGRDVSRMTAISALGVGVTDNSAEGVKDAAVVLIAVKPWIVGTVAAGMAQYVSKNTLIGSVAAGVDFAQLSTYFPAGTPLFRIIPNTAATVGESMTFVASSGATPDQRGLIVSLFKPLGPVMEISEKQVTACTALASCGIAFAMRYVRAAMEGGVEMGVPAHICQQIVSQTIKGAGVMLQQEGTHPEAEIDKVTTPGGITIKGLNKMEEHGFTTAVIEGLKAAK